ncbi:Oxygen-independent coproporphyrinogen III oxidase [uncultured Paludibacter sp.]|uniref:Heme chaperone HemW n=1 Tax=uncultured Paludibacter sp. TaxID=497635 RepID=A0A653A5X9_9BACT|nr:Oxygen-independent coproporphyrinogen III oxidase [uncultured Paludibacter sp.]
MSGIYIHIPFCKTKCTYCDFFSKVDFKEKSRLLNAMLLEIEQRKNYLPDNEISTVYFGGGTPSTLSPNEIKLLLDAIKRYFHLSANAEITLEANPDDLSFEYLESIKKTGINRLSIGIQSFDDKQLKFINRRHNANDAIESIENAKFAGFENISIDLIYGLPFQTFESWEKQLEKAFELDIQHISAYGLTYEKNTPLWKQLQQGKVTAADDEIMVKMYELLIKECSENDFEQYEISNFAKKEFRSRHNSSYWQQIPYLGIGPSAHSYDGNSRQWNVASINNYCNSIEENKIYFEKEDLSENDKYNDYIMVRLRTKEGIDLNFVKNNFNKKALEFLMKNAKKYIDRKFLIEKNDFLSLSQSGILISNQIISDLMQV